MRVRVRVRVRVHPDHGGVQVHRGQHPVAVVRVLRDVREHASSISSGCASHCCSDPGDAGEASTLPRRRDRRLHGRSCPRRPRRLRVRLSAA